MKMKAHYFWRSASPFSQWYPCSFTENDITFNCAEQYMMYHKALLFGDEDTAKKVRQTSDPRTMKSLGREVKNFSEEIWVKHRKEIVYRGNYLKFTQNTALKDYMRATIGHTLVEASPYDRIWGIGLSEDDPRAWKQETWLGKNLLGFILTELRENLRKEDAQRRLMNASQNQESSNK